MEIRAAEFNRADRGGKGRTGPILRMGTDEQRGGGTSNSEDQRQRPRERIPDDQPAPHVEPRETHQTSEVPLGSGDRPVPPGSGGDSARVTSRPDPDRKDKEEK